RRADATAEAAPGAMLGAVQCRPEDPGATNSLPLRLGAGPLGAGADCGVVRRQWRARRSLSSALVPGSLPIPGSYYEPLPAPTSPSTGGRIMLRNPCNHTPRSSDLPSNRCESERVGQDPQYRID